MGTHNEYLKHKNWKNIAYSDNAYADMVDGLYEDCDILPHRQSMRDSAKFGNCAWKPWIDHKWMPEKWKPISSRLYNFLRAHIGKSYDKTYSEFREKFPHQCGKIDVVQRFKDRFLDISQVTKIKKRGYWRRNPFQLDWSYYVDEQGIIRNLYLEMEKLKPKEKNLVEVNVRKKEWMYKFNPVVFEDGAVNSIIMTALPHKLREYVKPDISISEDIYHEMSEYLTNGTVLLDITRTRSDRFWENNRYTVNDVYDYKYDREQKKCIKTFVKRQLTYDSFMYFIFKKFLVKDCDYMEAGSPEHKRYIHEELQQFRKTRDAANKAYEEKISHLLSDITYERKHKDDDRDIISRDRHGFDENSFKGEFYHGQKRKKNK